MIFEIMQPIGELPHEEFWIVWIIQIRFYQNRSWVKADNRNFGGYTISIQNGTWNGSNWIDIMS
jgi:hypothetical protein